MLASSGYQPTEEPVNAEEAAMVARDACLLADVMAAEACKRWGHDIEDLSRSSRCIRCGDLNVVTCDDCGLPKGRGSRTCDCIPF
jgi:hypothetical protein